MASNILDPSAILSALPKFLPGASQRLVAPQDGLAALFHTIMSTLSFRLIAVDDLSPAKDSGDNVLPPEWNSHGPGSYTFRYKHDQSSLEFILKLSKLGSRTVIHAIALESDKTASLDISTNDFISPSFYPHDIGAADSRPLVHGFISSNRVADLTSQFQLAILQKLVPGLRKDGYTEVTNEGASSSHARPDAPRPVPNVPTHPQPEAPRFAPDYNAPLRNPLETGRRDWEPFPRNPFAPPNLFDDHRGDGMFVGPNHPIFGGGLRGPRGDGRGPWGGDGFLPPMGAPPGARFDPIVPSGDPSRPFPGAGRGLPGGGNMNDPDPDEFLPPGSGHDSMFS
ncbi:PI31 proteasome regulator N-terminal-domain-containing protein [Cristinia sonorae]|uniref:PI31 proteasome regulator N-terminal-domain-containing protein n=1 Tax=Cristinia sonorae TaxID=1940300 RepID=A0A8K0UX91_9AGAR|nr:PI31 proteasome regulator N-terminal-domain-containing protein [Cristinia sonorae]